jgi:hypothetical protein
MSRTQRPAGTPPAQRSAVGGARGRTEILPEMGPHAVTGGSHALDLSASGGAGLLDVLLELAGAEQLSLHQTFTVWQREQDRILNRTWRRPGGLARPAGL